MAMVSSKSANPSIELITMDTDDETLAKIALEWVKHRRDKLTHEQVGFLMNGVALRDVLVEVQAYKVERLRKNLTRQLKALNTELSNSCQQMGSHEREDFIRYKLGEYHSSEWLRGEEEYQSRIVRLWRDIRKDLKRLMDITDRMERWALIRKFFEILRYS
jgi:hypothetical protein